MDSELITTPCSVIQESLRVVIFPESSAGTGQVEIGLSESMRVVPGHSKLEGTETVR